MSISFEASRSFCYRFARYTVLPEIQSMNEVLDGEPFRLTDLVQKVIDKYLTTEQQQVRIRKERSDKTDPIHSIIKFLVALIVKSQSIFTRLGDGAYQVKTDEDFSQEAIDESELAEGNEEISEFSGWIYAFTFPSIKKDKGAFPIKIGKTIVDVESRVLQLSLIHI